MSTTNTTTTPLPVSVVEFILGNKDEETKKKVAIIDADHPGVQITYGELLTTVKQVSYTLRRGRGVREGEVFCLFAKNSIPWVISHLSIMASGGVVTTVNPTYTPHELKYQLLDSRATRVVTEQEFLEKAQAASNELPGQIKEIILIGSSSPPHKNQSNSQIPVTTLESLIGPHQLEFGEIQVNPHDICCLPYSSGTTGLPKGVCLTHHNLISSLVLTARDGFSGFTDGDVPICVLPLFHIYGMNVILHNSLWRNGKMVLMRSFKLFPFLDAIERHRVTFAFCVPPMMVALAKTQWDRKYDCSSLRIISSGAAPLGSDTEKLLASQTGVKGIRQGYGMTETSGVGTVNPIHKIKSGSIGVLAPGLVAKIVDPETGKEVIGQQPGELCLKGPMIMKGYLNQAVATSNTIDSEGYLHTGDVAYCDEEGYYYIVDRMKELIKYKGFQVAPAELEALLLTHPGVADVAVIGVTSAQSAEGDEWPRAFVVKKATHQANLTERELQEFVASQAAHYKQLRGGVEFVESIPKSPSGKILRRQLREAQKKKAKL